MTQLFLSLLNVSFKASYIVLAILFIRFAFKRIPKSILCIMWSLVGIRLIMPVSIKSMFSLIPETDVSTNINQSISINNTSQNISNNVNQMMSSTSVSNTGSIDIMSILSIIWIIGMICMIIYTIYSYYKLYKKVNVSIQYSENVYLCDDIDTPFILGIIKPKIYIPSSLSQTQIYYVLNHELTHIRRKDHLYKPFSFLLLSVYWFNPILWLSYIMLCKDIESACDEAVIKDMKNDDKKLYLETLLTCSIQRHLVMACPLAFGEVDVKERTKNIIKYKKPTIIISIVSILLCLGIGIGFLTDPNVQYKNITDVYALISSQSLFDNVTDIKYYYKDISYTISNQSEVDRIKNILSNIEVYKEPVSKERVELNESAYVIGIQTSKSIIFLQLNEDCTCLILNDGVKPTYQYKIKNVKEIQELCKELQDDLKQYDSGYYDDLYINDVLNHMNMYDNTYSIEAINDVVKVKIYNGDKGNLWIAEDNSSVHLTELTAKPVEDTTHLTDQESGKYSIMTFKIHKTPAVIRLKNVTLSQIQNDYTFDQAISQKNITINVLDAGKTNEEDLYDIVVNEVSKYSNGLTRVDLEKLQPDLCLHSRGNYGKDRVLVSVTSEPHELLCYIINVYNRDTGKQTDIFIDQNDYDKVKHILDQFLINIDNDIKDYSHEETIDNKETFKNDNYINYNDITNIIKYLNVKDVKVLKESDMRLVFNFSYNDPLNLNKYCLELEKQGYVYNMSDGTIVSGDKLINNEYEISIVSIVDEYIEDYKKDAECDYKNDIQYNTIVTVERR